MKSPTRHEKKFLCFRIWYGRTGWNGERSLVVGLLRKYYRPTNTIKYALCFCLIWVWCNIGFECKYKEKE